MFSLTALIGFRMVYATFSLHIKSNFQTLLETSLQKQGCVVTSVGRAEIYSLFLTFLICVLLLRL